VDFSVWNDSCDADGLRGQMWLYAYEATLRGIAAGANSAFLEQDSYFATLYSRKVHFLNIDDGFTSLATTLRKLQGDNDRTRRVRADFLDDFDVDIDEYDDDDFKDQEFEVDSGY
jgi:hypothetical protein